MIINNIAAMSGIVRKQAEIVEEYKGVKIALLAEGNNNRYSLHVKDNYYYFLGYSDLESCRANIDSLNGESMEAALLKFFEEGVKQNSPYLSKGVAQFFEREEDFKKVKEYNEKQDAEKTLIRQREEKEKQRESERRYEAMIDSAEQEFKEGKMILSEMFIALCKRHEIKIPIKTMGWCKSSLSCISKNSYQRNSKKLNPSTVIFNYVEMLEKAVG